MSDGALDAIRRTSHITLLRGLPVSVNVWMRSANSATNFRNVNTNGNANNNAASNGNNWLRPALAETP